MRLDDVLTPEQVAEEKGCGRSTVYAAIKRGLLPTVKVLNKRVVPRKALATWQPMTHKERGARGGRPKKEKAA